MKLHLPTMLRKALLACFAAVSSVTFATGSAWADTYDLLASGDAWAMSSGQGGDGRKPVYHAAADGAAATITTTNWGQALAVQTAGADKMYTVGADNTLTFTMTLQGSSPSNSIMSVALTGTTQTLVLGTMGYETSNINYGLTNDTTADIYIYHTEATDWHTGTEHYFDVTSDGATDVVGQLGTRTSDAYTLKGIVTKGADDSYTMDLLLNDAEVASDVALGNAFDITRISLQADGGENNIFSNLTIEGALADIPTVTIEGNDTNDIRLIETPVACKIILNLDGTGTDYLYSAGGGTETSPREYTVNNNLEIQSCVINNGSSHTSYIFTGDVTGTGNFTGGFKFQHYTFTGNMSQYSGNMALTANHYCSLTFRGAQSGTGTIAVDGNFNKLVIAGATMNNSAISAANLEISGASSFVGDVTVSTLLSIGENTAITLGADASLTLGDGALIDLAHATYTQDDIGNRSYSIFASGSAGTHNLADLSAAMIKDAALGYEYAFADGAITMTRLNHNLFYSGGSMTWNDEADNTPFTSEADGGDACAFATGDNVTFAGVSNVTLGEDVLAAQVTVDTDATLNVAGGDYKLAAQKLAVNGTLNVVSGVLAPNTMTAADIGETGSISVKNGAYLDLTAVDSNVNADDYGVLNSTKIATEAGGYVKMAFNHQDNQSELKLTQNVTQAYNIEAVGAMMIHGNGTANSFSYTIDSGKSLIANGTSHGATGLYAINHGTIIISGGSVETSKLTLGHSSGNDNGAYWGKLTMTDGTLKIGNLTLRQNHNDVFSVTGGELEFTSATALTRGSNTRATITIQGSGAGDSERVTLKSATSAWALDGAGLTAAPTIGNATVAAAQDISLSNVALSGAIVKQGAGQLVLNTVNTDALSSMDIRQGYVRSATALTLSALTVADGAGFAYDLGTAPALITAANYSGALTLNLSNVSEGTYNLFQGAEGLNADNVSIEGVDARYQVTKNVTAGLLSIQVTSGGAANLVWDAPGGADNVWSAAGAANWDSDGNGSADTIFMNGDNVTFAGAGEEITISGDVAPASVTVSGAGYAFAGSGKITGAASLTVENGGVLEISSAQRYTGGTVVKAGGELVLSTGGGSGALKGSIDVYGTLKLNANDATGWGDSEDVVDAINVYEGGLLSATTTSNLTGSGIDINLQGAEMIGVDRSNLDLAYGGAVRKWSEINALAAAGATAASPTVSSISGVNLSLRQNATIITVEENAQLQIAGSIHEKTDRINGEGGSIPEGYVAGLNKVGAGELVLSGNNTYTQATTVAAGTLTLADGGVLNSVVTVNNGATFKLEGGSTYGAASLAGEGSIIKTGSGIAQLTAATTVSSLDIQEGFVQTGAETATISTLTAAAGTGFAYDLAAGQKKVVAEGFDGPITLKLISLANGTFELMQGAVGMDESDVNFEYSVGSRVQVNKSVVDGLAKLEVTIGTNNLDNLVWNTGGASDDWAAGGAANWTSGGAAEQFLNGDSVTFSGTGEAISIIGAVQPAAITVDGAGYSFVGSGSITCSGAVTVKNGGELTISTTNSFTNGATIEAGGALTITTIKALGSYGTMNHASVLGKVSGAGMFTIDFADANTVAVVRGSGDSAAFKDFNGTVNIASGQLYIGGRADENSGQVATFTPDKVIIGAQGALWTHYGQAAMEFGSDIDMISGGVLGNKDGHMKYTDAATIRFNVEDPAGNTYDAAGVVKIDQLWGKNIEFAAQLEGDGTVQFANSAWEATSTYKITGNSNTFAGTFTTVDDDGTGADKNINLRLGAQNAAQYADINLASTTAKSYLLLDSDATINGLYGVVDAENAVQAQGGNRTLTVTEGDFGGLMMNSGENVLALTKQGAGTLVLRGANTYTGATTINGGTLELAEGATMGTTAITVNNGGTLKVNAGTYANSITGVGTIAKGGTGSASLSGIDAAFAGTIDVQGGTLNTGTALEIGTNRTLKAGKTGATLSSALTLSGGTLALDYAGTGNALSLNNGALTLAGGTTLNLSGLVLDSQQDNTVDLLTGVGSLLGSDGNALSLTDALASTYFSTISGLDASIDTATLGLQLADGKLQLVVPMQTNYLVWGEGTGTWAAGQDFTAEDQDFTSDADVKFGALTADNETVTISGAVAAGKVLIDGGEGKTYIFAPADDASGIASAESITVNSGTACFWAGSLDMKADTTLAVNDGATLLLNNGAIADADAVDIVLNNGSTLEWNTDNTTDYSAHMTINGDVTLKGGGAQSSSPVALGTAIAGLTADSTTTLDGGYFSVYGAEVLTGTVKLAANTELRLKKENDAYSNAYNQNFTGEGSLRISAGATIILSGTNDYSGTTVFDNTSSKIIVQGAQALSANTTFNDTRGGLLLSKAADAETAVYNISADYSSLIGELSVGLNAGDGGPVSGVTLNLLSAGKLGGNVVIKAGNAMDWAAGATVGGTVYVVEGAELTLHSAVANGIQNAGTVKIDGDFTWDNTNKTYTGETQVLGGSTLTAAAPLTSGTTKGKVQLLEDGAMIITNSTDWANKVYGAGTLVLVNGVDNLDAIVDGAATDTLATAYVGMPVQTYGTTDVDGVLTIDDAAAAASAAKITDLVVNAGSSVNVSTTGNSLKIGQNLTLSGAGDAAATAGTAGAAALAITAASGETKISSNITLAADTTIYAGGTGDHRLNGSFNGAGYTLTKTGSGFLGLGAFATGSTNDLSGDLDIQGGTVQLVGMGTAEARQAIGKTTLASGTKLYFYTGHYDFADADGAIAFDGDATLDLGAEATAKLSTNVSGSSIVTMRSSGGNANGTLTLAADNDFSGTWQLNSAAWKLNLAHAGAAKNATIDMNASAALKLMDGTEAYNVKVLKGSVAEASIATEGTTRHTLNITNTLMAVANASYAGAVAGTVDVKLLGGMQKFSGVLGDGSTYAVSAGKLAIASTGQSGTHSFTATGGVLDMTGYTRAADATGADLITVVNDATIIGLNLGAGMTLADALADNSAEAAGAVSLGGSTVLGAGTMNFRVTDSPNTIPGTETPYKLTDTLYQVGEETGDTISLAGGGAKTLLNLSITNALTEILDPTEENAGDGYRDHTLISGLTLADTSAVASDFFATNLDGQDTGSTTYSLHFVQNAGNGLYDLVLRAMGAADTLFWNDADGGTWEAADQTPDSWVKAQMVDGTLTPSATTADFEQLDYVFFDDLTDGAGAAVTEVEITVAGAGVNIGNMTVQADTTNYTIGGGAIGGNTGASLTKTGTGTLTLTGANSYAGDTTISGGTVIAQNKAALSTTQAAVSGGAALVLDYAAATDADKALAVSKVTLTGATLRALQDAKVNLGAVTGDSHLQAAAGSTLAVTPTANGSGYLYINQAPEGYTGAALTGTVAMDLTNYGTYVHDGHVVKVCAGDMKLSGGTNDVFKTNGIHVLENATMTVDGGMLLSVNGLGDDTGIGTLELKNASKLEYRDNASTHNVHLKIVSEGGTLQTAVSGAVFNLKQGGLTLKGTETNAAADTTLSGGTWVLEQGAVAWDTAATGALAVAANTTVKVNDDTMKKLKVSGQNAKLASAKSGGSAAALSVETITVGSRGTVEGVNLTLTGTGSSIKSETNGTTGTADGVVVDVDDSITMDDTTPVALEIGGGVVLDSLTILRGEVKTVGTAWDRKIGGDAIVLDGSEAVLNLNGLDKTKNAAGQAPTILIHAGSLKGADAFNGHVIIDDKGVVQTIAMGGLSAANADVLLRDIETAKGVTTLTGFNGVKLADGSAFDLTSKLADGAGNVLFDFADDAATDAAVSAATGATVTIGVNGVLGDVLDAGSVSYTIADKSIAQLASAVAWDATLALYNISATFGTDGKLTLSATDVPLSDDDIYRSSEDNVGADGTQWAGNGANVYSSSEPYASVYIDKDTVIDLTQADAGDGEGLVLSNLIGRGNGANLTITGDGNDLVTINNNLEVADVDSNLRSLSFNGDIDVTGTELQLLNTVATPGAQNAGELDTDSVYQINGALTADADSPVTITSGILKLNGKGSNASELLGGVTVENETGWLQVSGEASIGGTLQVSDELGVLDMTGDLELLSGGKVTLLDGAVVDNGFGIKGAGEGKETLSIAKGATATLNETSHVQDVVLELQEGSTLVMNVDENTNKYSNAVDVDGLTGTGALQGSSSAAGYWPQVHITPQQDCTFSGDLSDYEGFIHVHPGKGTQTFDKVTTVADSEVELELEGKSVINVAEENGNKTLNLRILKLLDGSDTTVEMNTDSGAPAIRINRSSATMKDGAALTLSSAAGEVLSADDDLLFMEGTGQLSDLDGKTITLDITDNAFRRLSETAKLVVEGDKVYVDLVASETNRYEEGTSDPNAKAGAELLWNVDPSKLPADSALKAIDNAVAELMQNGNRDAAERALAATAGAGTAVLGSAFSADVERQLRAIRNRTTTMGVNQCEVNEGMPYVNAWINAEGDHREMDADGLAAGYTMDSWGGTVGFDVDITNHLTMGMAVTAMYGDLEADSADRAEGDFDTQYVSLFARVAHQAWTHTFVATLGRADVTLNRTVSVPGGSYETSGDTDGMAYGFMYEVARTFSLNEDGTTCWQPVFNVTWRHSSIDAYTESGADNALAVGEQDMNVLTFGAGARLQTVMGESLYNRASIFEARAMVKVDAGDREGEADVALLEGTTATSVKSAEIGAVGVEIGAGVTIPVGLNAGSIFIDGSAEFRSGYSNVNGTVGYRINF